VFYKLIQDNFLGSIKLKRIFSYSVLKVFDKVYIISFQQISTLAGA